MAPAKTQTEMATKKAIVTIKKMMEDKKQIHTQIKKGDGISGLKSKGIRFVKPL